MKTSSKRILITQNTLINYAGSEVITLELCRYFCDSGWTVTVFTNYHRKPFAALFNELPVTIVTDHTDERLEAANFDAVWVHHQLVPIRLISSFISAKDKPRFIYHHMSPYEPYESPFLGQFENSVASLVLANSEETKAELTKRIDKQILVLGNPAPQEFFDTKRSGPFPDTPRRILVVSNHAPGELLQALDNFKAADSNVRVDHFGLGGSASKLITPELLGKYDLVVTIGKTVQYCLVSRVPVYCYDRFGGPGFLSPHNFDIARQYNFSGRGFKEPSKTAQEIQDDITNNYRKAVMDFALLADKHAEDFSLSASLSRILKRLDNKSEALPEVPAFIRWQAQQIVFLLSREQKSRSADYDYFDRLQKKDRAYFNKSIRELREHNDVQHQQILGMEKTVASQKQLLNSPLVRPAVKLRAIVVRLLHR